MSKTITHDGKEYILKSEVDSIVTSRISKVSESRRTIQAELDNLKSEYSSIQERVKGVDALHSQIANLQEDLSHANTRYNRHSSIASHGITNPEVRDLVEWQYSKAMESKPKKDKVSMGEWLDGMKAEGAQVPHVLKPFFEKQETPGIQNTQPIQAKPVPQSNNGVQLTNDKSTSQDMLTKGSQDFEYYQKNRAKIKEMYYQKRGRSI
jgi:hypothetical protein